MGDNEQKKEAHAIKIGGLIKEEKFKDALDLVHELQEKKEFNKEDVEMWTKVCTGSYAVSLYSEQMKLANEKRYHEAIAFCKELESLIRENPAWFGLDKNLFHNLLCEWREEIQRTKTSIRQVKDIPPLEKRLLEMAGKKFKDEHELGVLKMLFHALIMPAIYPCNTNEDITGR